MAEEKIQKTEELNEEQLDEVSGGDGWFGKYDGPPM